MSVRLGELDRIVHKDSSDDVEYRKNAEEHEGQHEHEVDPTGVEYCVRDLPPVLARSHRLEQGVHGLEQISIQYLHVFPRVASLRALQPLGAALGQNHGK